MKCFRLRLKQVNLFIPQEEKDLYLTIGEKRQQKGSKPRERIYSRNTGLNSMLKESYTVT